MSASLVGSEMCIRDSFKLSSSAFRRGPRAGVCSEASLQRGLAEPARCAHCLLYTSDAADDM
eukprot:4608234-Alexandrium_andersonii.AAC.1